MQRYVSQEIGAALLRPSFGAPASIPREPSMLARLMQASKDAEKLFFVMSEKAAT
jgi:hypothetical protein